MRRFLAAISLALPLGAATGCANPEMGFPALFRGGPPRREQARAQHFDPYPTDAGGGDILGGRPEDYHDQIPEPARSRWTLPKFFSSGRPVPPPVPTPAGPPPTVVMPPPGTATYPSSPYSNPGYPTSSYPSTSYPASGVSTGGAVQAGGALQTGQVAAPQHAPTVALQPRPLGTQPAGYTAPGYNATPRY